MGGYPLDPAAHAPSTAEKAEDPHVNYQGTVVHFLIHSVVTLLSAPVQPNKTAQP